MKNTSEDVRPFGPDVDVWRVGKHLWGKCAKCGSLVKITGWLRGHHVCR